MTKIEWVKLADAYMKEAGYWSQLYSAKLKLAKEYQVEPDFIGNDYFSGPLTSAIEDILGDDFCYWCYECDQSFKLFNKNVTNADGSHPDVRSLGDLYEYSRKEEDENNT